MRSQRGCEKVTPTCLHAKIVLIVILFHAALDRCFLFLQITGELEESEDHKELKLLSDVHEPVYDTEEKSMIEEYEQKALSEEKLVDETEVSSELQLNISSNDVTDRVMHYLQSRQLDVDTNSEKIMLPLWDFAGQHLYYATHPVFLSDRAVYILVYNLNKNLLATAEPCCRQGFIDIALDNPNNETNLDNLLSWLDLVYNISSHKGMNSKLAYQRPPVIIVGTNLDQPYEGVETMERHIRESLLNEQYAKHVIARFFAVDNTTENDEGVQKLRQSIIEILKTEPYMGEEIPLRYEG